MTLSDQIAKGQEKLSLLLNGLQELNQERLMQEEDNVLGAIAQTFDLLIQILTERRDDLILKTKEIYQDAFASVFQRRKDIQAIITDIQTLEEESNKAAHKPFFQVEADIENLKYKYEELLQAADAQLEEIRNPVCNFEFDQQEDFLKGFLDISGGEMDGNGKNEKPPKCHISKSQSQSINNEDSECPSPDLETDRPNTSANMGSNTPILGSPEKHRRNPLTLREYMREPGSHNRSTPYLDMLGEYPDTKDFEDSSQKQKQYASIERHRGVNGDIPFLRKSIANKRSNLAVIQTNYPNCQFHNTYSSPQLSRKGSSAKSNKNLKKTRGEMESSAVGMGMGMGVRRVNSCDATETLDSNSLQRIRVREKINRKDSDLKTSQDDTSEVFMEVIGRKRSDKKDSQGSHRSKKADARSVREIVRMFSLNSKQRFARTETKI